MWRSAGWLFSRHGLTAMQLRLLRASGAVPCRITAGRIEFYIEGDVDAGQLVKAALFDMNARNALPSEP